MYSKSLALIGNILYHFDRALFGLLAPFLAPLFFPESDPITALIYIYCMIPLGLLTKSLGVFVFGRLGDTLGRAKVLSLTLMGMAVLTSIMGLLPTHAQAGPLAPLLLLLTRLGFDFFAAAETTGSALFLMERSRPEKRSLVGSLVDASGILGTLLASCAVWLGASHPNFWRVLFLAGSALGIVGWALRKIPNATQEGQFYIPTLTILWNHRRLVLSIAAVSGFSYANYYLVTTFMNGYLPLISTISKAEAVSLNSLLLAFDLILLPLFGLLSIKVAKEKLMLFAIAGITAFSLPLYYSLQDCSLLLAGAVRILLTLFGVCLAAPFHAWVYEQSPPNHRYLVGAMGTLLGGKLFGSLFPALSLWSYHQFHLPFAPAIPLILLGILALLQLRPIQQFAYLLKLPRFYEGKP